MSNAILENFLPGDFIGCFGDLRKGKTLNAFRIARDLQARYRLPVVSNIPHKLYGRHITTVEQWSRMRDCIFVWDEIQASLDSRQSSVDAIIYLTKESIYIGKRGIIMIYTSPSFLNVDVRYRRLTRNVYIAVQKIRVGGEVFTKTDRYWHPVEKEDELVHRYTFPLVHRPMYGIYPTLYGREPGEPLVLQMTSAPSPRKRVA